MFLTKGADRQQVTGNVNWFWKGGTRDHLATELARPVEMKKLY
jgi:hypothetical protein